MLTNVAKQINTRSSNFSLLSTDSGNGFEKPQHVVKQFERLSSIDFTRIKHQQLLAVEQYCKRDWINGNKLNYLRERVKTSDQYGVSHASQKELLVRLQISIRCLRDIETFFIKQGAIQLKKNGWQKTNTCTILVVQHLNSHKAAESAANINNTSCRFNKIRSGADPDSDFVLNLEKKEAVKPDNSSFKEQFESLGVNPTDAKSLVAHSETENMPPDFVQESISVVRSMIVRGHRLKSPGAYLRTTLNQRFEIFKIKIAEAKPKPELDPKLKEQLRQEANRLTKIKCNEMGLSYGESDNFIYRESIIQEEIYNQLIRDLII